MNKSIKFGIISGAGPMAGCLMYQYVIQKLQQQGAWRDSDFPEILLFNVPFSDMLSSDTDNAKIRRELLHAIQFLHQHVDYIYIACQTLHAYLQPDEFSKYKVLSLLSIIKDTLTPDYNIPLVVASKTSRVFNLHPSVFPCSFAEEELSDQAIENILRGGTPDLKWLEALAEKNTVILGCTEFSVVAKNSASKYIDPIVLAATDLINIFMDSERCEKEYNG